MGCLDDTSPAGCGQVMKAHQPQGRFVSCWWSVGQRQVHRPGAGNGLPCPVPGSLDFSSHGSNAPCGMAGVQWEGRGVGKGLCEMVLPQFVTLRQTAWVYVPESSPCQV